MIEDKNIQQFLNKVKKMEKGEKLDLSSDEDLSIAIMNLISIEEHLFFTGNKTGKTSYFQILNQTREMRKELLKKITKDYEGELWCLSKHLLAASMRLFEVGTKAQTKGEHKEAQDLFKKSYDLYNLFWGLNLGLVERGKMTDINPDQDEGQTASVNYSKNDFLGKVSGVISKILDCCRE